MTYLYIKTHNKTGLKYFGKTSKPNPEKYTGSGKYWLRHLKKHGFNFSTEIIGTFEDETKLVEAALTFSIENNIVDSKEWANLRDENGLDGAPKGHAGHKFTIQQREIQSENMKKVWEDHEFRERVSQTHKDRWTEEDRQKYSEIMKEAWTVERRAAHSEKLKGHPGHTKCKDVAKPDGFGEKVSASLRGLKKSDSHCKSLSEAAKNRKKIVCESCGKEYLAAHRRYHYNC